MDLRRIDIKQQNKNVKQLNFVFEQGSIHSYQGSNFRNINMIGFPLMARSEIPLLKYLR